MSRMLGERRRSQDCATYIGVTPSEAATASMTEDCNGLKPITFPGITFLSTCRPSGTTLSSPSFFTKKASNLKLMGPAWAMSISSPPMANCFSALNTATGSTRPGEWPSHLSTSVFSHDLLTGPVCRWRQLRRQRDHRRLRLGNGQIHWPGAGRSWINTLNQWPMGHQPWQRRRRRKL